VKSPKSSPERSASIVYTICIRILVRSTLVQNVKRNFISIAGGGTSDNEHKDYRQRQYLMPSVFVLG